MKGDDREGKYLWGLNRFSASLYDEFVGLLLLFLQTAGSPQRAESLERMNMQQANDLLDWGVAKLDVSILTSVLLVENEFYLLFCFVGEQGEMLLLLLHVYSGRRCLDVVCAVHARHRPPATLP